MQRESTYHVSVLLRESIDGLDIQPDGIYVDVTYGGGGHSREILHRLGPGGRLIAFDQDGDALLNAIADSRLTLVRSNFRYLRNWLRYLGIEQIDGLTGDLGMSSHHVDEAGRGFTFRADGPLDMRMNQSAGLTAAQVVNDYSEERLVQVLRLYGELAQAPRLARAIVKARSEAPLTTTGQLLQAVEGCLPREREKKEVAKLFQALRIEVNHELQALSEMLSAATAALRPGGRLSIITYHSLEDRIVKNVIRSGNVEGRREQDFYGRQLSPLRPVGSKGVEPTAEEVARNPRSRSARLRIGEKI